MKTQTFPRMHVSYHVSNISSTVDFYTKFFGVEPVKVKKDYAKFLLSEPSLNISFIKSDRPIQKETLHFGIEVDNPDHLKQKLGSAMRYNLPIEVEKEVKCCYAKQDKFWVTDPDGYKWEVFQFMEDVEVNDTKYSGKGACCTSSAADKKETTDCC